MSVARNVLLMLPTANAVSGATGDFDATTARPLTPVHDVPSGNMTVADTPGMPAFLRNRSSDAWSALSSWLVAVGTLGGEVGSVDGEGDGAPDGTVEAGADAADNAGDGETNATAGPGRAGGWPRTNASPPLATARAVTATGSLRRTVTGRYPTRASNRLIHQHENAEPPRSSGRGGDPLVRWRRGARCSRVPVSRWPGARRSGGDRS